MDVSVVVTCWNGSNLLEKNLPKLLAAAGNPQNRIREIIVVDDFSTDNSVRFVHTKYPQIKVIVHDKNYGYATVCNSGVGAAESDLVSILNADVSPAPNFLAEALPHFEDKNVFSVTFNEQGQFGPGKLSRSNKYIEMVPQPPSLKATVSDWAGGGSSIFRKSYWENLNGMNELFNPYYFEDVDLGIRAGKAGYVCLWEPKCLVGHQHESTINPDLFNHYNRKNDINLIKERNRLLLFWEHSSLVDKVENKFFYLIPRIIKHPGYIKIVFHAMFRRCTYRGRTRRYKR